MLKYILPKGKDEYILLGCLFVFYFILSFPFIFNTSITDSIEYPTDTYFSFDTPCYYRYGKTYLSAHPIIPLFTYPIIFIGDLLHSITGIYKYKTLLVCIATNLTISLSCIYIYKYCKQIIALGLINSLVLAAIYSVFSTNFILSFTIETFTFSAFFLTFALYYYSLFLKSGEPIPLWSSLILPIIIGGITITNYPIAVLPILFSNDTIRNKITKSVLPLIVIALIIITEKYSLSIYEFDGMGITTRMQFYTSTNEFFIKRVFDLFWGAPILFSKIEAYTGVISGNSFHTIILAYYNHVYQYIIITIITVCIVFSIIRGFRNKFIIISLATILLNIFIHVIMKYGLAEPFMYGGHWVYTIPVFMGWLQYYMKSKKGSKLVFYSYIIIFICLFLNNTIRMIEFKTIAENLFPAY